MRAATRKVSFFRKETVLIELAGLLAFDILHLAMCKEVGTWEVDLKNNVGFGANFTLS